MMGFLLEKVNSSRDAYDVNRCVAAYHIAPRSNHGIPGAAGIDTAEGHLPPAGKAVRRNLGMGKSEL